jgi:hypothetical protein
MASTSETFLVLALKTFLSLHKIAYRVAREKMGTWEDTGLAGDEAELPRTASFILLIITSVRLTVLLAACRYLISASIEVSLVAADGLVPSETFLALALKTFLSLHKTAYLVDREITVLGLRERRRSLGLRERRRSLGLRERRRCPAALVD